MTKIKPFFLLLPLFMLACSLTAQATPQPPNERSAILPAPKQINTMQESTPSRQICKVNTGFAEGRLNVRSCGSLACPVLSVIVEGEILTLIQPQPVNGWLEVQAAGGLHGWINSNYCEVKK